MVEKAEEWKIFFARCLCKMPNTLVRVKEIKREDGLHFGSGVHLEDYSRVISDKIGILLSSYAKAINKRNNRHGSLFQNHTNAKPVPSDRYLITLLTYIHQNPVRSSLVEKAEEW